MFCVNCNNNLANCVCGNVTERMRKATDGPYVATKWCAACDNHYTQCRCENPNFQLRADGKLGPLPSMR